METQTAHDVTVPPAVRCDNCHALAREQARERISDTEVAVRYECPECRHQQTRRFTSGEINED